MNRYAPGTVIHITRESSGYQYGIRCGYEVYYGETLFDLGLARNAQVKLGENRATLFLVHDGKTDRLLVVGVADLPVPRNR